MLMWLFTEDAAFKWVQKLSPLFGNEDENVQIINGGGLGTQAGRTENACHKVDLYKSVEVRRAFDSRQKRWFGSRVSDVASLPRLAEYAVD